MYVHKAKKQNFWIATTRFNDTTLRENRRWMGNLDSMEWKCIYLVIEICPNFTLWTIAETKFPKNTDLFSRLYY